MKKLLTISLISLLAIFSYSQEIKKDTTFKNEQVDEKYINRINELLESWYVKNYMQATNSQKSSNAYSIMPDNIYEDRLKSIQTPIKLTYNNIVKEYINYYTVKARNSSETILGFSKYYFPIFEEILDKYNVPLELKYLPIIESAFLPNAVSWAGASGLWQFMYSTGKMYGLKVDSYVDDRRDPIKATEAAAKFLRDLYNIFGDWQLALAAYNCGPGNVNKAITRSGGKKTYWEIYYYLPKETRGYVPKFIAATYLANYYKEHGITPREFKMPILCDTLTISQDLHFKFIAQGLNIPNEEIKALNPQYKREIIPGNNNYKLRLPFQDAMKFIQKRNDIYKLQDSILNPKPVVDTTQKDILVENNLNTDVGENTTKQQDVNIVNKEKIIYTVKSSDNIFYISKWFAVSKEEIKKWNNLTNNSVLKGQKLEIYVPKKNATYYKQIENMSFMEKQYLGDSKGTNKKISKPKYTYHKTKKGESMSLIANKYKLNVNDIMKLNGLKSSNLKIGQMLKIPQK